MRAMAGGAEDAPVSTGERSAAVRRMFSAIAPRYDLLNHLLSMNVDRLWRRRAVAELLRGIPPNGRVVDACAGTLDLALTLAGHRDFAGRVDAVDFAWPMLELGARKVGRHPISITCGDAHRMPFGDAVFDGAMVGFGIRNLADIDRGFREFARVLRPGAPLVVLEFTMPRRRLLRRLYLFYFLKVLPRIGRLVSGHEVAYDYLPESVLEFDSPETLAERMVRAGFVEVEWRLLSGGIAALHTGRRA